MWAAYECYLTAYRDVLGLKLPIYDKYRAWEQTAIHGGFRIMHKEFCIVSDFPEFIKIDEQNRPHCATGPSHRWRDGWELFHLHGVRFNKDLFYQVISGKMPFEDILALENTEQRQQAMRFGDVYKFLEYAGARRIDAYAKYRPDGREVRYFLYRLPAGEIFSVDAFYAIYDCPSTGRVYMSGVEPCQTVAEAMAWKMSDLTCRVTPEAWQAMRPLEHES